MKNYFSLSKPHRHLVWICLMILLSFAGALISSPFGVSVLRADSEQAGQSISISGPAAVISGEAVQYQIQYNGVVVNTGGVKYTPPAEFTVTQTDPPSDATQGSTLIWWGNSEIGESGVIAIDGTYDADPCVAGDTVHNTELYDTHGQPAPVTDEMTTALYCSGGAVGGRVFNDINGNGVQDAGEDGIAGVEILLSNGEQYTTNTDANGNYQFGNLLPGIYTVVEFDPPGFVSTTPNAQAVIVPDGGTATANFGDQQLGTVSGTVFEDLNGDGEQGEDEDGIAGVTITLANGSSETTTTDANGTYQFTNVSAGNYTVIEDDPAGYVSTTPNQVDLVVPAGGSATANFGDQQAATVSGVVFNDFDGDGEQSDGEEGIAGVTVQLINGTTRTTTTDADGAYEFTNVTPGSYIVQESDPSGFVSTTPNSVEISVPSGGSATANFGDQEAGTVSGTVFNDLNGNGMQDDDENGLADVTITLSNGSTRTATTDDEGNYQFTNVSPGNHTVSAEDLAGFFRTTPGARAISVPVGGSGAANFGYQPAGTVSGVVFNDLNGDGTQDENENGIGGVLITLSNGTTMTTTTAGNGSYIFTDVVSGTYTVIESDPPNYISTTPNSRPVFVASGGSATAYFGDQRVGTVSGVVFNDINGDGQQNGSEQGIGGVRITLNNSSSREAFTAGDGSYSFDGVTPGVYTVIEEDPEGYVSTTPNSRAVSIASGGSATANFGDQQVGIVSGVVFNDANGNGTQDANESGLAGVTVTLNNGTPRTTTTAGNGSYLFLDVTAGAYTVVETDPDGFVSTTPNSRNISVPAGGSATANFGDQSAGTVSGVVFNDLNGDGEQNVGENGIGGVTVRLINGTTRETTTAGDGSYSFSDVTSGAYTVQETDPDGYVSTTPNSRAVSVAAGGSASANFGDQLAGTVSGVVFNDLDGDGVKGPNEVGLGGVTVELINGSIIETTTAGDGSYLFTDIEPGAYRVKETDPDGFVSTTANSVAISVPSGGSASARFGDQQTGTVSGMVYEDLNGNGLRNAGEPGIPGVTIALVNGVIVTTTTVADGSYLFTDVAAGPYAVQETDPEGYVSTTHNAPTVSVAPNGSATVNFGDQQRGVIRGEVFNDLDGNGMRGTGEGSLSGVEVNLYQSGILIGTTDTTGDGSYSFSGVTPDEYTVCATTPDGFVPTTSTCRTITLGSGSSVSVNFGFQEAGSVSGIVFSDFNGNGTRESGEAGLGGVFVDLRQNGSTVNETWSSGDGSYIFTGVSAGQYQVCATTPGGFAATTPTCRTINLASAGSASANFGFQRQSRISGQVFNDTNANGLPDLDELGISGVTVQLFDSQGGTTTTTSSGDGSYSFEDLSPGNYSVFAHNPAGFIPTCLAFKQVSIVAGGSASANFCFQRTGTISGVVFEDNNGNGIKNGNEFGIGGVLITRSGGITTTTTTNGSYLFNGVVPGNHTVTETDLDDYVSTTPNNVNLFIFPGGGGSASFGDQRKGTASGRVCEDLNGNGVQNGNEVGIGGVEIRLYQNDVLLESTNTNTDGSYEFSDITPGSYRVTEIDPPGYSSTSPNVHFVSIGTGGAVSVNFCDRPFGTVSGIVFQDSNANGIQDAGETGLGGVQVELASTGPTQMITTAGDGSYQFNDLAPGNYTVIQFDLDGYVSTTPNHRAVVIAGAGSSANANFGDQRVGIVTGVVFDDLDGDGVRDENEAGLGGVEVQLSNGILLTTTTVSDGSYIFDGVAPGNYAVIEIDPNGYTSTTTNNRAVTVSPGGSATANFGDQVQGTISGTVYNDRNGNGTQNAGEIGLGGVIITLSNGSVISTTTSGNGLYQFANLSPGNYTACEEDPDGFVSTTPNCYTLTVGSNGSASATFGDQAVGTVTGVVFDDSNGDGERDDTESGIGDVVVTLINGVAITTTTSGDGSYTFSDVTPGSYTVVESDPTGYVSTTANSRSVSVAPASSATANFGDQATGTVGGTVFYDLDGNGLKDSDEDGLGQVEVRLVNGDTEFSLTTGNGTFLFTDVTPGTYTVQVIPPSGVVNTTPNTQPISLGAGGSASASFGFQPVGSVSGVVFNDTNGNGTQDPSEGGIGGVNITLVGNSNSTTTTTSNGSYSFTGVAPGSYTVQETDPNGYVSTTGNTRSISVAPAGSATANFGDQPVGSVSGIVFNDLNSNGIKDGGETGIGGVVISLINGQTRTTTTAGDGSYSFTGVPVGSYTVQESDPDGFVSTTTNNRTVSLSAGGSVTANFGDQQTSSISGRVFNDLNGNGSRDSGEPGIGGVLITLSNGQTHTVTTAGDGTYTFSDLTPGNYAISESDPDGFVSTTSNGVAISLASGSSASVSFGDQQTATVSGIVFNDLNGDGIWQAGELGIGGVEVNLIGPDGTVTTLTAGNGLYLFGDVTAGTYTVNESDPEGFVSSSSNVVDLSVAAGNSASANFGDQQEGTVSGTVFEDTNGNGVRDGGESGLSNVEILMINIGTESQQTVGDGSYFFADVTPALYIMVEIDPEGFSSTTPNTKGALVGNNGSASADFGDQAEGSISGVVFNDLNGNGVRDAGEPGISGVEVQLLGDEDALLDSTATTGNGSYQFNNLSTGRYTVVESDLPGFTSSTPNDMIIFVTLDGGDTVNFGDVETSTINGQVFNDTDGNGERDESENGISGVTIELYQGDTLIDQTTTIGDGSFSFSGLNPANYTVKEINPPEFVSTTPDEVEVLLSSGHSANVSFGDRATGTLSGDVFLDINGDGSRDAGEVGLGDVLITLKDASGTELENTRTNTNGEFEFHDLPSGTYIVEETDPFGVISTTPNEVTTSVAGSSHVSFGDAQTGTISGQVDALITIRWWWWSWTYVVRLANVTVELWNDARTELLETTTTAGNGVYQFNNVEPGNYWVHEINPPRYWSRTPDWVSVYIPSNGSGVVNYLDEWDPCVFGVVYHDLNQNGMVDEGEPNLDGVPVRVVDLDGTVIREGDTSGGGTFLFRDIALGTYIVEVEAPDGWTTVTENPVSVALIDEDQGESVSFGLVPDGADTRENTAGNTGVLRGTARDIHGNELAGLEIVVKNEQGDIVGQAVTIADGSYTINGLPTGKLIVEASELPGYVSVTPNSSTVYLSPNTGAVATFIQASQSEAINGVVFDDTNGNGERDTDETGISGVVVQLEQNGKVVDTITTTINGAYSFPLVDEIYDIVVTDAEDYVSTTPNTIRSWGPSMINFGDRFIGVETLRSSASSGFGLVAGRVYNDIDGSGTSEIDERALGGIVITLRTLEGAEVATMTTLGNGGYAFEDVTPGAYEIVVEEIPGFLATSPSKMVISVGANSATSVDFGYRNLLASEGNGTIVGRIFNDLNSDQRFNPNSEVAMAGVRLSLLDEDADVVAETLSSGDGSYAFNDITSGKYYLSLSVPTGFANTTPNNLPVMVTDGELTSVPYGLLGSNTVGGSVFFDSDGDTKRHSLERGAGGLTVSLRDSNGALVSEVTTSVNGDYLFTGLAEDDYTVELSVPEGLVATSAAQSNLRLLASSGASRSFGLQAVGTISGIVFQDLDGDGTVDESESGLSGVSVSLNGNGVSETVTTFSNGFYQLLDLAAGSYTIAESDPTGFTSSQNEVSISLEEGQSGGANFGDLPIARIGGTVFNDVNQSAMMEDGEPGFGGAKVELLDANGTLISSVTARANGTYAFDAVASGSYTVAVIEEFEFAATTPQEVTVDLGNEDSQTVNFGLNTDIPTAVALSELKSTDLSQNYLLFALCTLLLAGMVIWHRKRQ